MPNCSARARFGFLFGSILSTCPSHVQRLFSRHARDVDGFDSCADFSPTVLFLTRLFGEKLVLAILM